MGKIGKIAHISIATYYLNKKINFIIWMAGRLSGNNYSLSIGYHISMLSFVV